MKKHRGTSWDKIKDLRNLPFFYTLKNYDGYIKINTFGYIYTWW